MPITKRSFPTFALTHSTPITVLRKVIKGEWINGKWVEAESSEVIIEANVQPVQFKELMMMPESERTKEWIKIYSVSELRTANERENGWDADEVIWDGYTYRVMKSRHYVMGVLDHYHAMAAREVVSAGFSS